MHRSFMQNAPLVPALEISPVWNSLEVYFGSLRDSTAKTYLNSWRHWLKFIKATVDTEEGAHKIVSATSLQAQAYAKFRSVSRGYKFCSTYFVVGND